MLPLNRWIKITSLSAWFFKCDKNTLKLRSSTHIDAWSCAHNYKCSLICSAYPKKMEVKGQCFAKFVSVFLCQSLALYDILSKLRTYNYYVH